MRGAIRRRDIAGHPVLTYRSFGGKVLARALLTGADRTFLSIVREVSLLEDRRVYVPEVVERCIELKLAARDLYASLARKFPSRSPANSCFERLATHKSNHAELLELCREVAARGRWDARQLQPVTGSVQNLERLLEAADREAQTCQDVEAAFRIAIAMESSEVSVAFRTVIESCDVEFVRRLKPFHDAYAWYLDFLCRQGAKLAPSLASELRRLSPGAFSE
jgi:hypothetical protein